MGSLRYRGDGRWQLTVSQGADERGRYRRTSRTFDGAAPTATGRPPKSVQEKVREIEADLARSTLGEPATFAALVDTWFAEWRVLVDLGKRAERTSDRYEGVVRNYVRPSHLARKRVRDVTVGDLDRWYLHLERDGLTGSSVHQVHAVVSQAFDMAVRNAWVAVNPARLARRPSVQSAQRARVTPEQVLAVLLAAYSVHPARARLLRFAARTGLRRGELCGLRWSRVDTAHGLMIVDTAVVETQRQGLLVKEPKGRKAKEIPLDEESCRLVLLQQEWQIEQCRGVTVRPASDPWLFSVDPPFSAPVRPRTLNKWVKAAARKAGVDLVLHDLRHYSGSELGDAVARVPGASRADVQAMLRHAQPATTDRYMHSAEDHSVRRQMLALQPALRLPGVDDA